MPIYYRNRTSMLLKISKGRFQLLLIRHEPLENEYFKEIGSLVQFFLGMDSPGDHGAVKELLAKT